MVGKEKGRWGCKRNMFLNVVQAPLASVVLYKCKEKKKLMHKHMSLSLFANLKQSISVVFLPRLLPPVFTDG